MKLKSICIALSLFLAAAPACGTAATVQAQSAKAQAAPAQASDSQQNAPSQNPASRAENGYRYNVLENGTIEISGYTGKEAQVTIPSEIDGKQVTRIGDSAFAENKDLKSVEIPGSVTSLADYAFTYCTNLEKAVLSEGMKRIGEHAFAGCTSLKDLTLPDTVESIDWKAFASCTSLTELTFPKKLKTIDTEAFSHCKSLTCAALPEGTWFLGETAFAECTSLASISLPKSITDISKSAFANCTSLKDVYYAGSKAAKKKIRVFGRGNEDLMRATIHYGNTSKTEPFAPIKGSVLKAGQESYKVKTNVSDVAFVKTSSVSTNFKIPASIEIDGIIYDVASITANAFKNNKKITKVTVEGPITSIGSQAFRGCPKLKTVVIKSDVINTVGKNAFLGTPAKLKVKVPFNQVSRYQKLLKGSGISSKAVIMEY